MIVASHKAPGDRLILTVIDSQLKGKRFEQGTAQLDLSADFFNGEEKTEKEIRTACAKAFSIYFVGAESVKLGLSLGLLEKDSVKRISDVPHGQLLRI